MENDPGAVIAGVGIIFWLFMMFVAFCSFILTIVIYWKLATKAGYPGITSLLLFVPIVNLFVMLYYVFAKWPIQQELEALRRSNNQY